MKIFYLLLVASILASCATLSREQCQSGDWYGIGLADGHEGKPETRINDHSKACAEFGIQVDSQQYFQGRAQGLIDYCHLENAFDTGLKGQRYQHVCSPQIDATFDRYNTAAYDVYRIRTELDSVDSQLSSKEYELRKKDLSEKKRHEIRSDIRSLDRRRDRLRDDLYGKERYMDRLMDEMRFKNRRLH